MTDLSNADFEQQRQDAADAHTALLAEQRRQAALRLTGRLAAEQAAAPTPTPPMEDPAVAPPFTVVAEASPPISPTPVPTSAGGWAPGTPQVSPSPPNPVVPLFEAVTSSLAGDVDSAGERLVVWPDRIEQIDARGRVTASVAVAEVLDIQVQKRLTSSTLTVTTSDGQRLVAKGVKSASATALREVVATLKLSGTDAAESARATQALGHLKALADMGLLSTDELAELRQRLAQMSLEGRL